MNANIQYSLSSNLYIWGLIWYCLSSSIYLAKKLMTGKIQNKVWHTWVKSCKTFFSTNRRQKTVDISLFKLDLTALWPLKLDIISTKDINWACLLNTCVNENQIISIKYLIFSWIHNQIHVVRNTWDGHRGNHFEYSISLKILLVMRFINKCYFQTVIM